MCELMKRETNKQKTCEHGLLPPVCNACNNKKRMKKFVFLNAQLVDLDDTDYYSLYELFEPFDNSYEITQSYYSKHYVTELVEGVIDNIKNKLENMMPKIAGHQELPDNLSKEFEVVQEVIVDAIYIAEYALDEFKNEKVSGVSNT